MSLQDYLGHDWKSKAGLPIVNVPGCPVQPDNFMETLLYLLRQLAGLAPMIPLDEQGRPQWLFGMTVHMGCDRAGYYEQADSRTSTARPNASSRSAAGALRCNAMCQSAAGFPALAGAPMSAGSALAARCRAFPTSSCRLWTNRPAVFCLRD
jgi:hydrogenase small subunit